MRKRQILRYAYHKLLEFACELYLIVKGEVT